MATARDNALAGSGLPIFFPLGTTARDGLTPPANRHGQSVRVWARSLSVMQKEAVALSAATGSAWRVASDEGPYLDGFDAAPCPLSFMSTGMVADFAGTLLAIAKQRGIVLRELELAQDNYYTMQGSALRGTMTGGALPVELEVKVDTAASDETAASLVGDAITAAPVSSLLQGAHASVFSVRRNGEPVEPGRSGSIAPLEAADPGSWLDDDVIVAAGQRYLADGKPLLVERVVPAASIEGVVGGAHTSLAETQQRQLHVHVSCRVRPDGLFDVEQRLFSPLGSTFRFVCDPAGASAPDPATYIAAGIAFCFMTQLGRYAKIVGRNLDAYNVIQDSQLPRPGRSAVDPIETHAYLTTREDDDFARQTVVMGEQTCFLHALCRTDLSVDARIKRL